MTTTITREQVEDFLYAEADLLDSWRLDEWVGLFDQERGGYYMPTTDHPDGDPNVDLFLIADDMPKLRSRVEQLLSGLTWAENPRSRTRHMVSNVLIDERNGDDLRVSAAFAVHRFKNGAADVYVGSYLYGLTAVEGKLKIREKRCMLDMDALRPHGRVSILL